MKQQQVNFGSWMLDVGCGDDKKKASCQCTCKSWYVIDLRKSTTTSTDNGYKVVVLHLCIRSARFADNAFVLLNLKIILLSWSCRNQNSESAVFSLFLISFLSDEITSTTHCMKALGSDKFISRSNPILRDI